MTSREKRLVAAGVGAAVLVGLVAYIRDCRHKQARESEMEHQAELDRLWTVCEGNGMPAAGIRTSRVPHPTISFSELGEHSHVIWDGDPGWVPESVRKTQLVACFRVKEDVVEMCHYVGEAKTGAIFRIRRTIAGSIRDAQTAEVLADRAFPPSEPGPCPDATTVTTTRGISIQAQSKIYGEEPHDAMLAFVREHAENP